MVVSRMTPEEKRQKWGVPDWRDASAYPETLPDHIWRWEFLRRLADYRKDYQRAYASTVKWYRQHSFEEYFAKGLDAPGGPICPNNWDCDPTSPNYIVQAPDSLRKYRLQTLCNPAEARPHNLQFISVGLIGQGTIVYARMALTLDPNATLEAHIKVLKAGLKMLRKKLACIDTNKPRAKWMNYLRALDADAEYVSPTEIWRTICPKSRAKNASQCGSDLVDHAKSTYDRITKYQ